MKIQIRRGVFETNSSSVHTIAICKDDIVIPRGSHVKFGYDFDNTYKMNNCVQRRANEIFSFMVSGDSLSRFIKTKNIIEKVLKKYDITCEFIIPDDIDSYYEDEFDNVFYDILEDKNVDPLLVKFLFNDDSIKESVNNNYFSKDDYDENKYNLYIDYD